jgi:hypothetical protein
LPVPANWLSYTGAPVPVDRRPLVALGAPVTGSGWAALGSCCDGPHRRALYPIDGQWSLAQRFAIDFNKLNADNRPGVGDPTLPTSFPTFGQPVLAVADATVAEAVDRYPDLNVGQAREDVTPESAGGNASCSISATDALRSTRTCRQAASRCDPAIGSGADNTLPRSGAPARRAGRTCTSR